MELFEYKLNDTVDTFALIKSADSRLTRAGKPYLALTVQDRSGDISGNLWDATPAQIDALQPGKVIHIDATRSEYNGAPQLNFNAVRLATSEEPLNPAIYLTHAPLEQKTMEKEVNDLLFQITEPIWNRIVRELINQVGNDFYVYPAAKSNHHAFSGGLAFHTLSITRLANSVADQYPTVNRELLLAGAILHDLGKTIELSGAVSTEYTLAGNLIGHIVLIDEQIVLAAQKLQIDLQSESMLLLRHTVLAHHGLLEYGSPVHPQLLEANILHQLDELDASIQMIDGALEHTSSGSYSERIFGLDSRRIYHSELHPTDNKED